MAMKSGVLPGGNAPGANAVALTKSDTDALLVPSRWLWVGGTGDVTVIMEYDNTNTPVTFKAVPVGRLDVRIKYLMSTNTTATNIVAVF